tara:strand:- start:96 stop:515 length:420 start_codon:yes stop_codon:yes gene_type:complete
MNYLKKLLLLILLPLIITSCARYEVVDRNIDKETRTISISYKYFQKDKQKIINQKYNKKYNKWLEAKCGNGGAFESCAPDEIVFTKKASMIINILKKSENNGDRNIESSTGNQNNSDQNEAPPGGEPGEPGECEGDEGC